MRILFLAHDREDYLADSLFHGLHQLVDIECVDYPRKDILYNGHHDVPRSSIRSGGFTLYKLHNESDTITIVIKSGNNWKLASLMPSSFRTSGGNGDCYCNGDHYSSNRA